MSMILLALPLSALLSPVIQRLDLPRLPTEAPIVGRATCGDTTRLLTNTLQLAEISIERRRVSVRPTVGVSAKDRVWGLACLTDGSMWTLESAHSLVQLTAAGTVLRRMPIRLPWLSLFAVGDRFIVQQLPTIVASPVLKGASSTNVTRMQPWIGLVGRPATSTSTLPAQNLVNCGIASNSALPCWFADERRIVISNGAAATTMSVPAAPSIDAQLPIWDAAVTDTGRLWVLATSPRSANGRRAAGTLLQFDRSGLVRARIDLPVAARLIVSAAESRSVLLLSTGELSQVILR